MDYQQRESISFESSHSLSPVRGLSLISTSGPLISLVLASRALLSQKRSIHIKRPLKWYLTIKNLYISRNLQIYAFLTILK